MKLLPLLLTTICMKRCFLPIDANSVPYLPATDDEKLDALKGLLDETDKINIEQETGYDANATERIGLLSDLSSDAEDECMVPES